MTEAKFPSEIIDLPSHGWFYDSKSSLASGRIELKYLTAKEEDILTSSNLIQKGVDVVLDKLLESLIVDKSIVYSDLLIGDKNGIMIAARVLGYGKDYATTIVCTNCGEKTDTSVDLTKFDDKEVKEPSTKGVNSFKFKLPLSGKTLTFKLLTHKDEKEIATELVNVQKAEKSDIQRDLTTRFKHIITAIDGDEKPATIREFVDDQFFAKDSLAFRQHYVSVNPDLDMTFNFTCPKCDTARRMAVPVGLSLFWPDIPV